MRRRARRDDEYVPFHDLYNEAAVPLRPRGGMIRRATRKTAATVGMIVGSILLAIPATGIALPFVAAPAIAARNAALWWENLPQTLDTSTPLPQKSVILDRNGNRIATYYSQNRTPVTYDALPQHLIDAVVAIEDERYWTRDQALDIRGTLRALVNNQGGGAQQGGSTIIQQYVKNLLLTEANNAADAEAAVAASYERKIRELRYAVTLAKTASKEDILTGYLNVAYFGNGAYGVQAAAQRYFSKTVSNLTLPEAAILAAVLKSPTNYDPIREPRNARERRDVVLAAMARNGYITPTQKASAQQAPLALHEKAPANGCNESKYPEYCTWVLRTILTDPVYGSTPEARQELLNRGGLTITTALDPTVNNVAQTALNRALAPTNRVAAAAAIVQPGTGQVLAIADSRRWGTRKKKGETQLLLPVMPSFQPGSTFKPITLATALEKGHDPREQIDAPGAYMPGRTLNHPPGGFHNQGDVSYGPVDAYTATAKSVNTYYVQLIERYGVLPTADMAARLGMASLPRDGQTAVTSKDGALTLGAFETSPLDMATVYATFASGGVACTPVNVLSITRSDGTDVRVPTGNCHQALEPDIVNTVNDILPGVFKDGGTGAGFGLHRPAGGKTGTTNDSAATWFTGYTPDYSTAVWVGDPRGGQAHPLVGVTAYGQYHYDVYGRTIAAPIWNDVMTALHDGLPEREFPRGGGLVAGTPTVPDTAGLTVDAAVTALLNAGYYVKIDPDTASPDPLLPTDTVATQSPGPGTPAAPGATVTVTLTAGSTTNVTIPDSWQPATAPVNNTPDPTPGAGTVAAAGAQSAAQPDR